MNPAITLRAVEDDGRFIEVSGTGFSLNQPVRLDYIISDRSVPTTSQTGDVTLTSNGTGRFIQRIKVNLAGEISGAQVKATDIASAMTATASI